MLLFALLPQVIPIRMPNEKIGGVLLLATRPCRQSNTADPTVRVTISKDGLFTQ